MMKVNIRKKIPWLFIFNILALWLILMFLKYQVDIKLTADHGSRAAEILDEVILSMPESNGNAVVSGDLRMPVLDIEGRDYSGLVRFDSFDTQLPLLAEWDEIAVKTMPVRLSGSLYDGSLVVEIDASGSAFSKLKQLDKGDPVEISDLTGIREKFTVSEVAYVSDANSALAYKGRELILVMHAGGISDWRIYRCSEEGQTGA